MPRVCKLVMLFVVIGLLAEPAVAGSKKKKSTTQADTLKPPRGFVTMHVAGVMESKGGKAVVLKEEKNGYLLPIWIGEAEAFAIQLRLSRRSFQRPLTHDLLDKVVQKLGGELIKIHVDDLQDNTFLGTVFIRQNKKIISIDARPSDSIALAVGNKIPIFVSQKVLDRAGIKEDQLKEKPGKDKPNPDNLLKDILDSDREEHTL
ncbi:MAG: bifunctional nuclease family protein [Deltaproteobacteria bacterium]|nr:bifunctional nuclease family protein [Deltaproteobacteria bacterium]